MAKLRIILADDQPFVLLGFRSMLAAHNGVVIVGEARTPASLLALLQGTPCDVLVIDLSMPDPTGHIEDGLALVMQVRRNWPAVRVVVVTAQTNPGILRAAAADSAISVLGKTDSLNELQQAVLDSTDGARYLGRSVVAALAHSPQNESQFVPAARLSGRQTEIVRRLVCGESIGEIAAALGCHRRTVSRQKREAMVLLGATSNAGLFSRVRACGMSFLESEKYGMDSRIV
ncbi:response regulator transcription factor [Paraburkholderia susongensis]|uniref:response regulator transcription factor n=1 Tax=Paraburkholderia susongensis TaxID=1515439 RepID=UPI000A1C9258|nr:response regulator transcription factor [Paraburkholderia susongensis]